MVKQTWSSLVFPVAYNPIMRLSNRLTSLKKEASVYIYSRRISLCHELALIYVKDIARLWDLIAPGLFFNLQQRKLLDLVRRKDKILKLREQKW